MEGHNELRSALGDPVHNRTRSQLSRHSAALTNNATPGGGTAGNNSTENTTPASVTLTEQFLRNKRIISPSDVLLLNTWTRDVLVDDDANVYDLEVVSMRMRDLDTGKQLFEVIPPPYPDLLLHEANHSAVLASNQQQPSTGSADQQLIAAEPIEQEEALTLSPDSARVVQDSQQGSSEHPGVGPVGGLQCTDAGQRITSDQLSINPDAVEDNPTGPTVALLSSQNLTAILPRELLAQLDEDPSNLISPPSIFVFTPDFLKLRTLGVMVKMSVGERMISDLRIIEHHYFKDRLLRTYDFSLGQLQALALTNLSFVYNLPQLSADDMEQIISSPMEMRSDRFFFVEDRLIAHSRARYSYAGSTPSVIIF